MVRSNSEQCAHCVECKDVWRPLSRRTLLSILAAAFLSGLLCYASFLCIRHYPNGSVPFRAAGFVFFVAGLASLGLLTLALSHYLYFNMCGWTMRLYISRDEEDALHVHRHEERVGGSCMMRRSYDPTGHGRMVERSGAVIEIWMAGWFRRSRVHGINEDQWRIRAPHGTVRLEDRHGYAMEFPLYHLQTGTAHYPTWATIALMGLLTLVETRSGLGGLATAPHAVRRPTVQAAS